MGFFIDVILPAEL